MWMIPGEIISTSQATPPEPSIRVNDILIPIAPFLGRLFTGKEFKKFVHEVFNDIDYDWNVFLKSTTSTILIDQEFEFCISDGMNFTVSPPESKK